MLWTYQQSDCMFTLPMTGTVTSATVHTYCFREKHSLFVACIIIGWGAAARVWNDRDPNQRTRYQGRERACNDDEYGALCNCFFLLVSDSKSYYSSKRFTFFFFLSRTTAKYLVLSLEILRPLSLLLTKTTSQIPCTALLSKLENVILQMHKRWLGW